MSTMPIGFEKQNELLVYGDGDGNVVIEEFVDSQLQNIGMVKIPIERFEHLIEQAKQLRHEAYHGSEESSDEA